MSNLKVCIRRVNGNVTEPSESLKYWGKSQDRFNTKGLIGANLHDQDWEVWTKTGEQIFRKKLFWIRGYIEFQKCLLLRMKLTDLLLWKNLHLSEQFQWKLLEVAKKKFSLISPWKVLMKTMRELLSSKAKLRNTLSIKIYPSSFTHTLHQRFFCFCYYNGIEESKNAFNANLIFFFTQPCKNWQN